MAKPMGIDEAQLKLGQLAALFIERLQTLSSQPSGGRPFPCEVAVVCFSRMPDGELAIGMSATIPTDVFSHVLEEILTRTAIEGEPAVLPKKPKA